MTEKRTVSLKEIVTNPKESIHFANGWQRIWLIVSGLILVLHLFVLLAFLPNFSQLIADTKEDEKIVNEIESWQKLNQSECMRVAEVENKAKLAHYEKNKIRRAEYDKVHKELYAQIERAKERLFQIETTGGKYYPEWGKVNDQIHAYTIKYTSHIWSDDDKNYLASFSDADLISFLECTKRIDKKKELLTNIQTEKENASYSQGRLFSVLFWTIFSYFAICFSIYGAGWTFGWAKSGFGKN